MKIETIVVTGNIGSGKSTVINTIKATSQVKVEFFSFDDFTRELYNREDVKAFLVAMFGTSDRKEISDKVFAASRQMGKTEIAHVLRDSLNEYFFKFVEEKFLELVNRKNHQTLVIEFPMFFEMKQRSIPIQMARSKVKVITVACDESLRLERVKNRDGFTEEKIAAIVASQLPQEFKVENADYVIDTSNDHCETRIRDLMKVKFKRVFNHAVE